MFTIYHSNKVESLKIILNHLMQSDPLDNPFATEQILVQSPGMSQWLKMAIAQQQGVAANIDFPLPATFIWNQFTQLLPDVPKRSAFNKESMTWKIMHLLPTLLDLPEFSDLAGYLQEDEDLSKRYQLAEIIADIFDGYLVYRPDWINQWEEQGTNDITDNSQAWQPMLWKALYDYTLSLGHSKYHRANLYQDFIDALSAKDADTSHLPKRLFIFGITALPPRYLEALKAMGEHIDVHFFFCNPCQHYWGDIKDKKTLAKIEARSRKELPFAEDIKFTANKVSVTGEQGLHLDAATGNDLLASMGKLGRDNLALLSQLEAEEYDLFIEDERDSLLHHLHSDILHLTEHQQDTEIEYSHHKQVIEKDDKSLLLHVCHSPMREVEVVHNQLLRMFEDNPNLNPRDVIVMVADIDAYSPAIQAVFGSATGARYIPFSISDRSSKQESPILAAFMQMMQLSESRCSASEILEILEVPAISARFDISEAEFTTIKQWVSEVGIRWGMDGETARRFGLPTSTQNSWLFGLQRMLLGYAVSEDIALIECGEELIAPYNEVQGMGAQVTGKLAKYVNAIAELIEVLEQSAKASQWNEQINGLLEDFFEPQLHDEMAIKSIRDAFSNLVEQLHESEYDAEISLAIVYEYLESKLSDSRVSQRFLAGQVNFCTLMPMRSIPFEAVCLLGMNDGVFPRSVPKNGFDLMGNDIRLGDRARREDERYLFLEALLSAKSQLHISYVGQSIQDNSEKVPSVLLAELMDYVAQNYCLEQDVDLDPDSSGSILLKAITSLHPLTPFSLTSFEEGSSKLLRSYASEWLSTAQAQGQEKQLIKPFEENLPAFEVGEVIDLAEFQRFWRLPVEYFFTRRLKVNFTENLVLLEDDEPFALNGLQSYLLKDDILRTQLSDVSNNSDALQLYRAQGILPVGSIGDDEYQQNLAQVEALLEKIEPLTQSVLDALEVNLPIDLDQQIIPLQGWLKGVYSSGLVRYRCGQIRAQDYLAAWIDHLSMSAGGTLKPTHILGYKKKEGVEHYVIPAFGSSESAQVLLTQLVELFIEGLNAPLPYLPRSAHAAINAQWFRGKHAPDTERSLKKMQEAFEGGFNFGGEGDNDYIARIWPAWNTELAGKALQLAEQVLMPVILQAQEAEEYYSHENAEA